MWAIGAGVYVLAVFHRSTLGVAGPLAAERLHLSAAQLSSFVMLQLAVYALMQVPTGIMVDRFGPRRMLLAATLTMGTAQVLFSLVTAYVPALLARGLLGCGDAMTYICGAPAGGRVVPGPPVRGDDQLHRAGRLAGQHRRHGAADRAAAQPRLANHVRGRRLASRSPTARCCCDRRRAHPSGAAEERAANGPVAGRRVWTEVKSAWRLPSGRLGFWVHFTCMAGPTTFATLWGFPYLTQGLGYSTGRRPR